jgi:hypothetical protein
MGQVTRATRAERHRSTPASVLAHPVRVRVLEILNQRDMSPVEFCREGFAPEEMDVSHVAYHFRELAEYGCLRVIEENKRRGSIEHVYRGTARAYFSDAQWNELDEPERVRISKTMIQGLFARVEGALMSGIFDSRIDRHLTWVAMKLDEQGWREMSTTLAAAFGEIEQIRGDAERRLEHSGEEGIPSTCALLGFPSSVDTHVPRPPSD